jgi:thiamine-phosphate pyrophosphorylase
MTLPRLYPILDTETLERHGCDPVCAAEAMLEAGAGLLQFRHKGHYGRTVFEQARRVAELCRRFGVLCVVDDRADIAVALDCGVHVGQDDLPAADARAIVGPGRVVGLSTHNPPQFAAAIREAVDYVALGPVFATASKRNPDAVVGVDGVRALVGQAAGRPVVAIGGITCENARAVLDAGAASLAVIAGLLPEQVTYPALRARMEEWQRLLKD